MKKHGTFILIGIVVVVVIAVANPAVAADIFFDKGQTTTKCPKKAKYGVNCNRGQTITKALKKAKPGDTIVVRGTCNERVTITTDRLTLKGVDNPVIDGGGGDPTEFDGVVTIDGARGVTITGFTIQNGHGEGILGMHGAAFAVNKTTVQDMALTGISISGSSTADLTDCTVQGNMLGLNVFTGSSVILRGAITASSNSFLGIEVDGQSIVEIRGATLEVNHNGVFGLLAVNSEVAIYAWKASEGSTLTANHNGDSGINLAAGSVLGVFARSEISATYNGRNGIFVSDAAVGNPTGAGRFVIENNPTGLNVNEQSRIFFIGGLTVLNNETGVMADGADTVTIVSIPPNPATITNNGTDVDLRFGTRATFEGVTIDTIKCDDTVLSRGTTVCPKF